jgi:hypothetical protein
VAAVLAMSPAQCKSFFEVATDFESGRKEQGITEISGAAAAENTEQDMHQLDERRRARRQSAKPLPL